MDPTFKFATLQVLAILLYFFMVITNRLVLAKVEFSPIFVNKMESMMHVFALFLKWVPFFAVPVYSFHQTADVIFELEQWQILPETFQYYLGITMMVIGLGLFLTGAVQILVHGKAKSLLLVSRRLVTTGLYRYMRDPMANGSMMVIIGYSMYLNSRYMLLFSLIFFVPATVLYTKVFERKTLELKFGMDYLKFIEGGLF